jgi:glycerophosphoryl diester phosphodiesterase
VVAEIKHSSYFAGIGLPVEARLIETFARHGWTRASDPAWIESFEVGNLRALRKATKLRLVQLVDDKGAPVDRAMSSYAAMITPDGLERIATYADAIGAAKALVIPRDEEGRSLAPTTLVQQAHKAGLKVIVWTLRSENFFLPAELRDGPDPRAVGRAEQEVRAFAAAGVDGIFTDHPAIAVRALGKPASPRP